MSEPLEGSVTLDEIFSVVGAKRAPLAPELAGYLALEIAESPVAREGSVEAKLVWVGEEGTVAVMKPRTPLLETTAEETIRLLLGKLLEAGGSQTPALSGVAKKKAGGGLGSLVEELEAALIPVNRSAGRRALARLAREVKRVTMGVGRNAMRSASNEVVPPSVKPPPAAMHFEVEESPTTATRDIPPEVLAQAPRSDDPQRDIGRISQSDVETIGITAQQLKIATGQSMRDSVDSLLDKFEVTEKKEDKALSKELKAMAGLEPTPPPPQSVQPADDGGVDALLGATTGKAPVPLSVSDRSGKSKPVRGVQPSYSDDRQLPTGPSVALKRPSSASLSDARKKKTGVLFPILVVLFVLTAAAVVLWMLKPGFFTGRTPEKIAEEKRINDEQERARQAALAGQVVCKASIIVTGAPDNSEILVRAGAAPVDIDRMPIGPRLEFVATLDGHTPRRAVIPAGAQWENGPDGKPRFEVAVQLDKSKKPLQGNAQESWPPPDPASIVGGKGDPGKVHVVATPKGADVWIVAGSGPDEARIDDLVRCDSDAEILVAGPTTYRKRLSVKAADFGPDPAGHAGVRVAKVAVPKK